MVDFELDYCYVVNVKINMQFILHVFVNTAGCDLMNGPFFSYTPAEGI